MPSERLQLSLSRFKQTSSVGRVSSLSGGVTITLGSAKKYLVLRSLPSRITRLDHHLKNQSVDYHAGNTIQELNKIIDTKVFWEVFFRNIRFCQDILHHRHGAESVTLLECNRLINRRKFFSRLTVFSESFIGSRSFIIVGRFHA